MKLILPKLRDVLKAISGLDPSVKSIFLVVSTDGWEVVSDNNKGISGYVSNWYDLEPYDGDTGYYAEIAECMLRDVKDDFADRS
jgi:hypothetical protein